MAQHDMNIANQGFPNFRSDLNNALSALVSNSSGSTAPSTMFSYQWWLDTSTTPTTLKMRNTANDAWITVAFFNQSTNLMSLSTTTITSTSATSLVVGANGSTNPAFTVDSSTASQVAGFKITGAATGGTVALVATDSGSNTNLTFNAKGTGTISIANISTGNVIVGGGGSANRRAVITANGLATFGYSDNSLQSNVTLENLDTSSTTNHGSSILWRTCDNSTTTAINSGRIAVIKEQQWTTTASTQDSAMVFYTTLDGSMTERMRIGSAGNLTVIAGTVGAPSIVSTTGTSDTGQWFPAADTIAWSTGGSERIRLNSSGNTLLNTTATFGQAAKLEILSDSGSANLINLRQTNATAGDYVRLLVLSDSTFQISNAGNTAGVSLSYGGTSWSAISDERKKHIIEPINDGLNKVAKLRSVIGRLKTDKEDARRSMLIAQDVLAVLPEAVEYKEIDDTYYLSITDVIPLLVSAIKDLKSIVESQQNQINALK
jgi:hypothetical protein